MSHQKDTLLAPFGPNRRNSHPLFQRSRRLLVSYLKPRTICGDELQSHRRHVSRPYGATSLQVIRLWWQRDLSGYRNIASVCFDVPSFGTNAHESDSCSTVNPASCIRSPSSGHPARLANVRMRASTAGEAVRRISMGMSSGAIRNGKRVRCSNRASLAITDAILNPPSSTSPQWKRSAVAGVLANIRRYMARQAGEGIPAV